MDDNGAHLPLLHSHAPPAQARGTAWMSADRTSIGEGVILVMPAEPTSGVWDAEVRLQCGRSKPNTLPIFGGPAFKFRDGFEEEEQVDFVQTVLPALSAALQLACSCDMTDQGKAVKKAYDRATGGRVLGLVSACFAWLGCPIFILMGVTLDPPMLPEYCFVLGGGLGVIALVLTLVTNYYYRLAARLADTWLVESSQRLHDNLVHGRASHQLLRAGLFVARGDPNWRPSKLCCNRVSREHLSAAYEGPNIMIARLQPEEIASVPTVRHPVRSTQNLQWSEPTSFDDDPVMSTTVGHGAAVVVSGAHGQAEDPFTIADDPAM